MNADLATQRALDRYHKDGVGSLSDTERTLATIWAFEASIANGGFLDFFKSRAGELAPYAPDALRAIDAKPLAEIAERANRVFGPDGPPADRERRREFLQSLPDSTLAQLESLTQEYYAFDEDLSDRIEAFIARSTGRG